jgi:hypothetical protein
MELPIPPSAMRSPDLSGEKPVEPSLGGVDIMQQAAEDLNRYEYLQYAMPYKIAYANILKICHHNTCVASGLMDAHC